MTIKQEILQLMEEKRKELPEIILNEKLEIKHNTIEYFEDLCKSIRFSIKSKNFDSLGNNFRDDSNIFEDRLTTDKLIKLNEAYINDFINNHNIKGEEIDLIKQEVFEKFSLIFYKYYFPGRLYYMPIDTQLLEELLNKEGLEYDKSSSDSYIVTPNFYPITMKQKKDKIEKRPVQQRKRKRY